MDIKYRLMNEHCKAPLRATGGAAAFDLSVREIQYTDNYVAYFTGVHFEIPEGYVGLLFPRSSISKTGAFLSNSVGVIDSDFRGEVQARFYVKNGSENEIHFPYMKGERCCQILFLKLPDVNLIHSDELLDTERGDGGFGSTNN